MASSWETAVKVSIAPMACASGGSPSRSNVNCRVSPSPPVDFGCGSAQSGVGPSTNRSTGAPAGPATSTTTWSCAPPALAMHGENGKAVTWSGIRSERDAPRHANFRLLNRCVFGAVAVERKLQIGLDRDAKISADGIAELEMQRRLFRHVFSSDLQRQDDMIDIADRIAAGAVGETLRRRPQHGGGFHIIGPGKIESRRNAGIAGIAPIGLPARIKLDLYSRAHQLRAGCFGHRPGDQSHRGMRLLIPGGSVLRPSDRRPNRRPNR